MSGKLFIGRSGLVTLAAFALAALAAVVFYERTPGSGKPGACSAASQALAKTLAPLTKGDLAGLRVSPRRPPALSFQGPNGARLELADFAGRALAVNFWATWCVPCRAEMPDLDALQKQAGSKDFEVVAVDVDTSHLERAAPFLDGIGVKSLVRYADPSGDAMEKMRLSGELVGLPTTLLIDREGCEIGVVSGGAKWAAPDALAIVKALTGT